MSNEKLIQELGDIVFIPMNDGVTARQVKVELFNTILLFLEQCRSFPGSKNYHSSYYDEETEMHLCIYKAAEELMIIEAVGSYKWKFLRNIYTTRIYDVACEVAIVLCKEIGPSSFSQPKITWWGGKVE